MDSKEREQLVNVCKHAARASTINAKSSTLNVQSVAYLEDEQIEHFANIAYTTADYDKPDKETFLRVWIAAYKSAQSMLISLRSRFRFGDITSNKRQATMELKASDDKDDYDYEPGQMLQSVIWSMDFEEGGFDTAYDKWLAEKVEAAAIPQESMVTA